MDDPAAGRQVAHLEAGAHRPPRPARTRSTLLPVTRVRVWQNPTTRAMCHTVSILSHSHGSIYFRLKSVIKKEYIFPYDKRNLNSKNYLVLSQRSWNLIKFVILNLCQDPTAPSDTKPLRKVRKLDHGWQNCTLMEGLMTYYEGVDMIKCCIQILERYQADPEDMLTSTTDAFGGDLDETDPTLAAARAFAGDEETFKRVTSNVAERFVAVIRRQLARFLEGEDSEPSERDIEQVTFFTLLTKYL